MRPDEANYGEKIERRKMETIQKDDLVFYISKEMIQEEAQQRLGRSLNFDEIETCKKGLEWGLMTGIDIVFQTIFTEMI